VIVTVDSNTGDSADDSSGSAAVLATPVRSHSWELTATDDRA
jgi:hypothetical protein